MFYRFAGAAAVLLAACALPTVPGPALAQGPQAATIDSNLTVKIRPYSPVIKAKPFATVVLLTGGHGVLNLNAAGDIRDSQGNFLIRSARRFLNARLNVAMLDAEPAFPAPNGLNNERLSQAHATHLSQVMAVLSKLWPQPVWLVGTSNGTLSAFNAAARLPGSPFLKGIALTSTVTQPDPNGEMGHVLGANPSLASITVPTLVMWHQNDTCFVSPASGAMAVFNGLTNVPAAKKATAIIAGGRPNIAVTACAAFHHHGYNGVEDAAVTAIATFINTHTP
jgi:pimeloyl-ACP methyl ester carboxylesterase